MQENKDEKRRFFLLSEKSCCAYSQKIKRKREEKGVLSRYFIDRTLFLWYNEINQF